jgi:alanine-synthesizing transaminase
MFAERTNWNLAPNRLSEVLQQLRAAGQPVVDLTASNPTTCGFAYDKSVVLSALCNPAALIYEPNPTGIESARHAVAGYYAARGDRIAAQDIVLTASTSEAYSYIFRAICNAGDEMLVPAPSYPLFAFLADIQDVKLARYPLFYEHGWQIDFYALEQAITPRTRGVVIVNPNNPTGHFVTRADAERLNEICRGHKMALISDEVFLDFTLGDRKPSLARNAAALTFTMSGLSKISGLPQMKVAWVVTSGPEEEKAAALARLEVVADTYLSVGTPVQLAMPAFLELRYSFQRQLMARVRANLGELDRRLATHPDCRRLELEGGWHAVLRVPATRSDEELAIELLESKHVYLHPGHFYDFPSDGYVVVSLIMEESQFLEGVKRFVSMF